MAQSINLLPLVQISLHSIREQRNTNQSETCGGRFLVSFSSHKRPGLSAKYVIVQTNLRHHYCVCTSLVKEAAAPLLLLVEYKCQ